MGLAHIWDGGTYELVPGEDFVVPNTLCVVGFDELDEDDLGPYETATTLVTWENKPGRYPNGGGPIPGQLESSAWGGMSLAMQTIGKILGGYVKAYELRTYDGNPSRFTTRFEVGQTGFQGGKL